MDYTDSLHLQSISILLLSTQQSLGEALVIALAAPSTENLFEATHSFVQAETFFSLLLWRPGTLSTCSALRAVIRVSFPQ